MEPTNLRAFADAAALDAWLKEHHQSATELWAHLFKKDSGTPSVDWNDLVIAGLTWGWIDGVRKSVDAKSFVQRMTPRRARSTWSKKNCDHAERLIALGHMQPAGLAHVNAAKADGRWERAYSGSKEMVIPEEFLTALQKNPAAQKFYESLSRANIFAIYHRVVTPKKPETRAKRITAIIEQLARGEKFH